MHFSPNIRDDSDHQNRLHSILACLTSHKLSQKAVTKFTGVHHPSHSPCQETPVTNTNLLRDAKIICGFASGFKHVLKDPGLVELRLTVRAPTLPEPNLINITRPRPKPAK